MLPVAELLGDGDGNAEYGLPVDCYAFGIMLWQLLTSLQPYGDSGYRGPVLLNKVKDGLRPIIHEWMPRSLETLIRACWAEAEHLRPTANELVQRLLAVQGANEDIQSTLGADDALPIVPPARRQGTA